MGSATIIDGRASADRLLEQVAADVERLTARLGRAPSLATHLVGDDPASELYVRFKREACKRLQIHAHARAYGAGVESDRLIDAIAADADDADIDAILVQLPLPGGMDAEQVLAAVPPVKDVDGLHPDNLGRTAAGRSDGIPSCTPAGVMRLLREYEVPLVGAEAVVVGRSAMVGRPMAAMLLGADATVTACHRGTRDLAEHTRRADVLVSAVGRPGLIGADMVKPGAAVIDVGTTRTPAGLRGDVDFDSVREVAGLITPVPGGVGPMTVASLMANVVRCAQARAGA